MIENKLIAIVGPTGSGKSELAVKLARTFPGEVINADSRQLYRHLSIGTAKPTYNDKAGIPHHLLDVIEPDQDYNVSEYQAAAYGLIKDIQSRNLVPFLTGGTGLYIWATVEGWQVPQVAPDWGLRRTLEETARLKGPEVLYRRLAELDPVAAARIDYRNVRRVIRALEIVLFTTENDKGKAQLQHPPYQTLIIGLTSNREALYQRIDLRVDKMIEKGLVEEVETILTAGFAEDASAFKSVGYREAIEYVKGKLSAPEMVTKIKTQTHRLVRHQYNWFKPSDGRIHWFDINSEFWLDVTRLAGDFLEEKGLANGFY